MMPIPQRARQISNLPALAVYLLTLGFSFATCAILLVINRFVPINETTIALIFLLPVGLSATLWGLFPGILAAFICFLALNYYFIQPVGSLTVHTSEDLVVLTAFLGVTIVISQLVGMIKQNLAAATDREFEALRLYEFSALLAMSQNEQSIGHILLEKVDQTLQPERIEILLEATPQPILVSMEHSPTAKANVKPTVEPLQSARGLLGEIRVWRAGNPIREIEQRLLKIFASQSALAIERLRLADAARRVPVRRRDRPPGELLVPLRPRLPAELRAARGHAAAVHAQDAAAAAVGRRLRHEPRLLADHGRDGRRGLPDHHRLGHLGLQGDPGRRRADGSHDRAGTADRPDRAVRARPVRVRPHEGRPRIGGHALSFRIDCPQCGRRSSTEFRYGGEVPVDWLDVWRRDNPEGPCRERWFHEAGCHRWLTLVRDTRDDRVLEGQ